MYINIKNAGAESRRFDEICLTEEIAYKLNRLKFFFNCDNLSIIHEVFYEC